VNLDVLDTFDAGAEVSPDTLRDRGLVHKHGLVKVLARGELTKRLTVRAHAFSKAAAEAIRAAGGTADTLPPPNGGRRPAARGNALTNR
jgi:large subunit ribosomal protein L15